MYVVNAIMKKEGPNTQVMLILEQKQYNRQQLLHLCTFKLPII